jgi:hypothetical protein
MALDPVQTPPPGKTATQPAGVLHPHLAGIPSATTAAHTCQVVDIESAVRFSIRVKRPLQIN